MPFQIVEDQGMFIATSIHPKVFGNLELGRKQVERILIEAGATLEDPVWKEGTHPCETQKGYWNVLEFRQVGIYTGRKIGLFGKTSGDPAVFCGPRSDGERIMIEAIERDSRFATNMNPRRIEGRKAEKFDGGAFNFGIQLPNPVSRYARFEELFETYKEHPREVAQLLD